MRVAFASSAYSCTLSSTKCVLVLFLQHTLFTHPFAQWDERSTGPPPPPAILVTGLNPLTPYPQVRRHFAQYGTVVAFDGKSDKYTGAPLGIVWVNYGNHELARRVTEKEDGQRVWLGGEGQVIKVELDSAQQEKCKQRVNAEIVRRKKEQEAKAMRPPPNPLLGPSSSSSSASASSATGAMSQVKRDASASTTATPLNASSMHKSSVANTSIPGNGILPPKPTTAFPSATVNGSTRGISASRMSSEAPIDLRRRASSRRSPSPLHSTPRSRSRSRSPARARSPTWSPRRPPSPVDPPPPPPQRTIPKPKTPADIEREREEEHEEILKVLEASGKEHIKIDGLPLGRGVLDRSGMIGLKEADVKEFFDGFEPDQVGPFQLVIILGCWEAHLLSPPL